MLKTIIGLGLAFSFSQSAFAEKAFSCKTSGRSTIALYFNSDRPNHVTLVRDGTEVRHVRGAGSDSQVWWNNQGEERTYKFDFGVAGKNLILNIDVNYDHPSLPTASGVIDTRPFVCSPHTLVVEYTVLDRIVNAR